MNKKYIIILPILCIVILIFIKHQDKELNTYFYKGDEITLSAIAKYDGNEERYVEENIDIQIKLIKEYSQGFLYQFELLGLENMKVNRTNIYFFVTDDIIYRLSTLYDDSGEAILYTNKSFFEYWNSSDIIMDNSEIVCQESVMENFIERDGYKIESAISSNEEQIMYSKTEIKTNGEVGFYEWFTWEKGKGMVEYGSGYGAERDIIYISSFVLNEK